MKIRLEKRVEGINPERHFIRVYINDVERGDAKISRPYTKNSDRYNLVEISFMNEADGKGHFYVVQNGEFLKEVCAADAANWERYL